MRRERSKVVWAGVSGVLMGGISGAIIGASVDPVRGGWVGGVVGAIYLGLAEAITDWRRQSAAFKPLWHRIIGSTLITAALGVVVSAVIGPVATCLLLGLVVGLFGLGPKKLAVGIVIGIAAALVYATLPTDANIALLSGLIVLIYRLVLAVVFRDTSPLEFTGEQVSPDQARYVVPFEAHTGYIGAEYMRQLAIETSGLFERNRHDIGIVESMEALRGPHFDPAQIDPLIREFYEHTTRFKLTIVPCWNPFIKPFFLLYRNSIARPIGQANLPFNTEEVQRGVVSYIDAVDIANPQTPDQIETIRGWVRAFEATGEAIYVGIYTVVRQQDIGYVSVGFPLPESNFTATLLPYNQGSHLLLRTHHTGLDFPGHYVSFIEDNGALTILKLPTMGEEIEVYIRDGQLKTDHRFYFGEFNFLTLNYSIEREAGLQAGGDQG
ncbi:MAG: hypothetical protein CL610_25400 [Anaerolineaceae bacterium]|nr:hypothetical protein [Anaerolineaceae bacterium]